jgi:DNA-directed RNA polymerase subunit K/omega
MLGIIENDRVDKGRYTSQEAASKVGGLYNLVLIASARARELKKIKSAETARSMVVAALADVEDGKVGREYLLKHQRDIAKQYRKSK